MLSPFAQPELHPSDGAVARPGTTRHLEVGEEDRFRCAGIYGGGRFVDGGHLVVSQLQLEPANVAQVLEQTSRQCSQFCVADVYRQRFPLKTGKCTAADTRKSGTREGDVVDLEW